MLDDDGIKWLKEKIENDASYVPYMPWSDNDDLTYDQVIEALENLNDEEEEILMSYFHSHQTLRALAKSLSLDFVRKFPKERTLRWFELFQYYGNETVRFAKQAEEQDLFGKRKK